MYIIAGIFFYYFLTFILNKTVYQRMEKIISILINENNPFVLDILKMKVLKLDNK